MASSAVEAETWDHWISRSFVSPTDKQVWHSVYHILGVNKGTHISRTIGVMLRCTAADIPNPLRVVFSFGSVLRTKQWGEIEVDAWIDEQRRQRLHLMTRNQANAEIDGEAAHTFVAQLLSAQHLKAGARLMPKGRASMEFPLGPAIPHVEQMLANCGIGLSEYSNNLSGDLAANTRRIASPLERAFIEYWQAQSSGARQHAAQQVMLLEPTYDQVLAQLISGAPYAPSDQREIRFNQTINGANYPTHLRIPSNYNPKTKTPLFIYLHGGISRPAWRKGEGWWQDGLFDESAFVLSPGAWRDAPWWDEDQIENVRQLIIRTKQQFNIDDNRVYVLGISDGGAGAYYWGSRFVDPFAGFISIIGSPGVLFNERVYKDGKVTVPPLQNMVARPWYIINGAEDKSHPSESLDQYFQSFKQYGVDFVSILQPEMGHAVHWRKLRDGVQEFVESHTRESVPQSVYWQTQSVELHPRSHWIVIEKIDQFAKQACVFATLKMSAEKTLVLDIESVGARELTFLVPAKFAQSKSLILKVNGHKQNVRLPSPSAEQLLTWHMRDYDRSQLYAGQLKLTVDGDSIGAGGVGEGAAIVNC